MTLQETAERLYALPPEQFTAARDEAVQQARADGDRALAKELSALRRPTVPAWLVNQLVRSEPDLVEQALALGPALAEAQAAGQGDAVRALGAQRRQLVSSLGERAVDLAGRDVTAAQRSEVEQTLDAALADPPSADAVRTGRLVRPLAFVGFGGVDLEGAVAGPVATPAAAPARQHGERGRSTPDDAGQRSAEELRAAEQAALEAGGLLDDAVRACEAAERVRADAEAAEAAADREVAELEAALAAAQDRRSQAADDARKAGKRSAKAVKAVERAQAAAERARAALDALRRSG